MTSRVLLSSLGALLIGTNFATACPLRECPVSGTLLEAPQSRPLLDARGERQTKKKSIETSPRLWVQLKNFVYEHLPKHRGENFNAVWIGMSFETPDETVAGIGLEGSWR